MFVMELGRGGGGVLESFVHFDKKLSMVAVIISQSHSKRIGCYFQGHSDGLQKLK